jgi:phage terminase large subunit-like protein
MTTIAERQSYLALLEEKKRLQDAKTALIEGLPHLYGFKWYSWAWDFFTSRNRNCFLVAANQISKSSTQIRKCIHLATAVDEWKHWWKSKPTQFWQFYPSREVCTSEFTEKWVKEFLPRGEFKNHPVYGWVDVWKQGYIHSLKFNSGVTVYFKSYEQGVEKLQTSSVYALFCDEELPEELYDELNMRRSATNGIFSMVFTATLGLEIWRATMEEKGRNEKFPGAFKRQVSMYDCLEYMDGSPSPWTVERIKEIEASCKDDSEVQRRVYGRFVVDKDRKYISFARAKNVKPAHKLPKNWLVYAGVDVGSGGSAHPAAICFVAVNPEFTKGRVFKGWRGDGVNTDAGDILNKFLELRGPMKPVGQYYDHQSRDFFTVSARRNIPFNPADKSRDSGEQILNTLFKNEMLDIYDEPELMKLVVELENLKSSTPKPSARDDFIDALRFATTKIPWDFSCLNAAKKAKKDPHEHLSERERERRQLEKEKKELQEALDLFEVDVDLANEAMEFFDGGGFDFGE